MTAPIVTSYASRVSWNACNALVTHALWQRSTVTNVTLLLVTDGNIRDTMEQIWLQVHNTHRRPPYTIIHSHTPAYTPQKTPGRAFFSLWVLIPYQPRLRHLSVDLSSRVFNLDLSRIQPPGILPVRIQLQKSSTVWCIIDIHTVSNHFLSFCCSPAVFTPWNATWRSLPDCNARRWKRCKIIKIMLPVFRFLMTVLTLCTMREALFAFFRKIANFRTWVFVDYRMGTLRIPETFLWR